MDHGITRGIITANATNYVRTLVNEPSSVTTPTYLSREAMNMGKKSSQMHVDVFGPKKLKELGMHAFLSIAQGSDEEPRFITMTYGDMKKSKPIVLVGKGITYDSGGLSLKTQAGLEIMKCDMAGAATILGIFQALTQLKPDISVVGLIAATENMPSGKAVKPGDIVTAMNGTSIEIVNTDAEGRVILADAVSYAGTYFPTARAIIDVATLTGACVVALGEDIAGLFSSDETLAEKLIAHARNEGEQLWRLPLVEAYTEELKSPVADLRNVAKSRYGGAINGALFIREFVPKNIPWAHIDIAGPAFSEKESATSIYGATGYGVRFLLSFLTK